MIWEKGIETCMLSGKEQITSLCSIKDTGHLGLGHGDDPERWNGVGGGRGDSGLGTHVHPCLIHVNVWQNQYSIVKQNKVKIKIKKKKDKDIVKLPRGQITNICWIIEKAREFQRNIYVCFIDYTKAFDCVDYNKL